MNIKFCFSILFLICSISLFFYGSDGKHQNNKLYGVHEKQYSYSHSVMSVVQENVIPLNQNQITQQQPDSEILKKKILELDLVIRGIEKAIEIAINNINRGYFKSAREILLYAQNDINALSVDQYKIDLKYYKTKIKYYLNFIDDHLF